MHTDLQAVYIPSCMECQHGTGSTSKPAGPLHPLPVPNMRGDSIAIDFIGPLPSDDGYNSIVTITDCLGADICIAAMHSDITAKHNSSTCGTVKMVSP